MVELKSLKSYYFSRKLTNMIDNQPGGYEDTFLEVVASIPKYWFISTKFCVVFFAHMAERKWNDTVDACIEYQEYKKELEEYERTL